VRQPLPALRPTGAGPLWWAEQAAARPCRPWRCKTLWCKPAVKRDCEVTLYLGRPHEYDKCQPPRDGPRGDQYRHRLNEKTMPMLAKVLSIPEAHAEHLGLTALISAAVLAGKKPLAPMPFRTLATTTTQRPVPPIDRP